MANGFQWQVAIVQNIFYWLKKLTNRWFSLGQRKKKNSLKLLIGFPFVASVHCYYQVTRVESKRSGRWCLVCHFIWYGFSHYFLFFFFNVWISKSHLFLSLGHFFQVLTQQWIRFNNYMIPTKFVLLKNFTFHYDPEGKNSHLKFNNCHYFLALQE